MDHFTLHFPQTLIQTPWEIMIEALLLLVLFVILLFLLLTFKKQLLQYQMMLLLAISVAIMIELLGLPKANPKLIHQPNFTVSFKKEQQKMLSFSKEKNILVFLLDGFSGGYINKFYKKDPLMFDEFTGFTFYPNTLTTSTATWSSIAAILGGDRYSVQFINQRDEKSIQQEITEAYNLVPSTLLQHDFSVSFFNPAYGPDLNSNIDVSDLTTYAKYFQKNHPFWSYKMTHNQVMIMVSLFRSVPLFMRQHLYNNGRWLGAYTSNHLVSSATAAWGFFDALIKESRVHENGKTFKFIHLKCPHFPHILDDHCEINPRQSRYQNDAVCALKKIRLFLQWMKANNIYDISKIIILSDHGWWAEPSEDFYPHFTKEIPPGYEHRFMPSMVQPLLMIKDFNQNKKLAFSNILLSNSDLPSMICSAIASGCRNIKADPTKNLLSDRTLIISNALIPKNLDNEKRFNVMGQYRVQGMIFDPANWKKIR